MESPANQHQSSISKWVVPVAVNLAIFAAYAWLQIPALAQFSLQVFAIAVLVFFALKFATRNKPFSLLPDPFSLEIIPIVFALLLLIGSTGAAASAVFSLTYILLLLLVLSTGFYTTIVTSSMILLFFYATSDLESANYWQSLLSIPLMVAFFMYSERQLYISRAQADALSKTEVVATQSQLELEKLAQFLRNFLKPKLISLIELGKRQDTVKMTLVNQLDLLLSETTKMEAKIATDMHSEVFKIGQVEQTVVEIAGSQNQSAKSEDGAI